MRKSKALVWYQLHLYGKSNRWVMPCLVWFLSLVVSYSIQPVQVGASILLSATIGFLIALWMGITYYDTVDVVEEQILILKVQSRGVYDLGQLICFMIMAAAISLLGMAYPMIYNCLLGGNLYTRSVQLFDGISSWWIHMLFASLGCVSSMLFQPRIVRNRKKALLVMVGVGLISLSKMGILESMPAVKVVFWLFPPVADMLAALANQEQFGVSGLCLWTVVSGIYIGIVFLISEWILERKNNYY